LGELLGLFWIHGKRRHGRSSRKANEFHSVNNPVKLRWQHRSVRICF
jgi:hypothetical protein